MRDAREMTAGGGLINIFSRAALQEDLMANCMAAKGYEAYLGGVKTCLCTKTIS